MKRLRPIVTLHAGPLKDYPRGLPISIEDLDWYKELDPDSSRCIDVVKSMMPAFQSMLVSIPEEGRGLRLDIILQYHLPGGMHPKDPNQENIVAAFRSQGRILRTLEDMQPRVLGVEGFSVDRITRALLTLNHLGQQVSNVQEPLVDHLDRSPVDEVVEDAGTMYALRHPEVLAVGIEDRDVRDLQEHILMKHFWNPSEKDADEEWRIAGFVRMLRSIIAISRTLRAAHSQGASSAVIVIGGGHRPEIEAVIRSAGISARIYDATR